MKSMKMLLTVLMLSVLAGCIVRDGGYHHHHDGDGWHSHQNDGGDHGQYRH